MEGGGRAEEDLGGGSKRARDGDQNTEQVVEHGGCSKKGRVRSENWSAEETRQMLVLRKAIVQDSSAKGSAAWEKIAEGLPPKNPPSQARSGKQVAQRWDTLVKEYVSVEEVCGETGKSFEEVIGERQKRGKTEPYQKEWHELIAQGNPGKRRPRGKTAGQPDGPPQGITPQATPASLSPDASLAMMAHVWKSDKIAKGSTEMLDTINHSISFSEERSKVVGQGDENIFMGPNGDLENDQERGVKNQQDETEAEVARTVQSMAEKVQNILKADSRSETFCLEVNRNDLLTLSTILSAPSLRLQSLSVQRISEEVGADVRIRPPPRIISTARSTHDLYNSTQPILSVISPSTSSDTFTRLSDIEPLSSGFSDVMPLILEPSDNMMVLSPKSEGRNAVLGQNVVCGSIWELEDDQGLVTAISTRGVKKPEDDMKAEVARATQSMADPMQSAAKAVSTSESFCSKVDQTNWSMAIRMLHDISQKPQATSVQGMREETGADERIPSSQQQPVSATRSGDNHTKSSSRRSVSLTSSFSFPKIWTRTMSSLKRKRLENSWSSGKRNGDSTASSESSSSTFAGLQDIMHLSSESDGECLSPENLSSLFRSTSIHLNTGATSGTEEERTERKLNLNSRFLFSGVQFANEFWPQWRTAETVANFNIQ